MEFSFSACSGQGKPSYYKWLNDTVYTKLYPNQFSEQEKAIEQALEKLNIEYLVLKSDKKLTEELHINFGNAYHAIERLKGGFL